MSTAAQEAYAGNMWEAGEQCQREGIMFISLAIESFRGGHKAAVAKVKKLGVALARHNGQPKGEAISRLFQWLSSLLIRENSALVSNRVPGNLAPALDEVQ